MTFHEEIISQLLSYKETHPEFRFIPRQRNTNGKLDEGYWFQGRHDYAFVGLVDRSGGVNMTRSVGLVFWPSGDHLEFSIEIVHKGEKDKDILGLYEILKSEIGEFTERDPEKFYKYIGDTSEGFEDVFNFLNEYYTKITAIFTNSNHPELIIDENKFKSLLSKINSYRGKILNPTKKSITILLVNITWNSKDWKEVSEDASGHAWVGGENIPHESWNFDFDNTRNKNGKIFGFAKFTNAPKTEGDKNLIIFYSQNKIVGFYGKAEILKEWGQISDKESYNLIGDKNLSTVLSNKIDNVKEKGYLENKERVGQVGFCYLERSETALSILDEAIKSNPKEYQVLTKIKEWIEENTNLQNNSNSSIMKSNGNKAALNQILYGPPGTGKTFNSINKALEIINEEDEKELNWKDRKAVKNLFDKRVADGRIIFTTFHQSMSYEDFIEGIKPKIDEDTNENKQVIYEVENGIFKRLVENAKKKRTASKEIIESYSFDDAWDDLVNEAERNLEENNPLVMSIQTPNLGLKIIELSERGNLKLKPIYSKDAKEYIVSFLRAKKLQEAFPDLSVIKNIDKEFRAVIGGSNSTAYWSVLNYINQKINNNSKILKQENELPAVPYILIIDEINRGNVSAIFGELITLIEEDKRLGKEEALEVTLPYSKEKFGVPGNLYIIGTMNTADRSVEALDAALRRRFCFEEMPPLYDLDGLQNDIFGYKAFEILKTVNSRIEKLIDKDHAIGHSYLLNKDENSVVDSFYKNIIPLLQEYFFGDYSKLGLVLGKGFVHLKESDKGSDTFADFDDASNDFEGRNVYEIIDYRKEKDHKIGNIAMTFEKAIKVLMKDSIE